MTRTNSPSLWVSEFPIPFHDGNKYDRGHAVVMGAPSLTGATRLAAEAASRVGAGLVSVVSKKNTQIYRQTLAADIMVKESYETVKHPNSILAGCGGITKAYRNQVLSLANELPMVLDADFLNDEIDFSLLGEQCILTPHFGEFSRMFPSVKIENLYDNLGEGLEEIALFAAEEINSIMVLKGPETVIAHPDGRVVTNTHASPYLAKAGTGDVLAGMITGLLAQSMPPFEAACAAVWMHGEAGLKIGPGLIASDLQWVLSPIIADLVRRAI